jgi:hypothetical protein
MPSAALRWTDLFAERAVRLPGVEVVRSRFGDRRAFRAGSREIAHEHGPNEIDLRLSRAEIHERWDTLRGDSRIGFRPGRSDWITIAVRSREDLELACELFETAWRTVQ